MWDKFKQWLRERRDRKQEKELKALLNAEIEVNALLGGPDYAIYNKHNIPNLLCSVYFNQDVEQVAVDFSREEEGIAHFMIFTKDTSESYKKGNEPLNETHAFFKNATVFMRYYADGSEGWCFKS